MDVLLANPRGFCAGVDRAIDIVERALELFGAPIYVRHEVVHNKYVVDNLKEKAPSLSKSSVKFPTTPRSYSAPMAYRKPCEKKPLPAI